MTIDKKTSSSCVHANKANIWKKRIFKHHWLCSLNLISPRLSFSQSLFSIVNFFAYSFSLAAWLTVHQEQHTTTMLERGERLLSSVYLHEIPASWGSVRSFPLIVVSALKMNFLFFRWFIDHYVIAESAVDDGRLENRFELSTSTSLVTLFRFIFLFSLHRFLPFLDADQLCVVWGKR